LSYIIEIKSYKTSKKHHGDLFSTNSIINIETDKEKPNQ
jgi:hypothetical protein